MENREKIKSVGDQGKVSLRYAYASNRFGDKHTEQLYMQKLDELAKTIDPAVQYFVGLDRVLSHKGPGKVKLLEPGSPFDLEDAGHTDLLPHERLDHLLRRGIVHENSNYQPPADATEESEKHNG